MIMKKYLPIILYPLVFAAEADAATPDNQGSLQQYSNLSASDYTDIFSAAYRGDLAAVKDFIERGADLNVISQQYGETVLHCAARSGNLEVVKYLVEKGANVNAATNDGYTVLSWAMEFRNQQIINYLESKGAN